MVTLFYLFRIVKHDKQLLCTMFVQSIGYRRVPKLILFIYFILPIAAFLQYFYWFVQLRSPAYFKSICLFYFEMFNQSIGCRHTYGKLFIFPTAAWLTSYIFINLSQKTYMNIIIYLSPMGGKKHVEVTGIINS